MLGRCWLPAHIRILLVAVDTLEDVMIIAARRRCRGPQNLLAPQQKPKIDGNIYIACM